METRDCKQLFSQCGWSWGCGAFSRTIAKPSGDLPKFYHVWLLIMLSSVGWQLQGSKETSHRNAVCLLSPLFEEWPKTPWVSLLIPDEGRGSYMSPCYAQPFAKSLGSWIRKARKKWTVLPRDCNDFAWLSHGLATFSIKEKSLSKDAPSKMEKTQFCKTDLVILQFGSQSLQITLAPLLTSINGFGGGSQTTPTSQQLVNHAGYPILAPCTFNEERFVGIVSNPVGEMWGTRSVPPWMLWKSVAAQMTSVDVLNGLASTWTMQPCTKVSSGILAGAILILLEE